MSEDEWLDHATTGWREDHATGKDHIALGPDSQDNAETIQVDAVQKLAHIIWRVSKQLISLLEKEYGFEKSPQPSKMIGDEAGKARFFAHDENLGIDSLAGPS